MKNSTITNCTLQNTLVQGKDFVGGFAGSSFFSNLFQCFNLGFHGSPSTLIISGSKIFKEVLFSESHLFHQKKKDQNLEDCWASVVLAISQSVECTMGRYMVILIWEE